MNLLFVMPSQKGIKLATDELLDLLLFKPSSNWTLDIVKVHELIVVFLLLVSVDIVIIHLTFAHLPHPSPPHFVHFLLIHVFIFIVTGEQCCWSPASTHLHDLLLLIKSLVHHEPLVHGKFLLLIVIDANIFVVIKLILLFVVLLHILHEILAVNLFL